MNKLVILVVGIFGAVSVSAQSKFDGVYGQVGVGYENASPSYSVSGSLNGVNVPTSTNISNSNSVTGVVTVGFMKSITKDFLLGLGVDYSPVAGKKSNYSANAFGGSIYKGEYSKESSYNIFLSPATPIGADGLLYGKVGYTGSTVKDDSGSGVTSIDYSGYSLGVGYKQIIQGGLYGFGEFNYMNYGNHTINQSGSYLGAPFRANVTSSSNAYNLIAGIGYKF